MNRNQKIAIGCGGAGCLGLIVVAVAAGVLFFVLRSANTNSNRPSNFNVNRSSSNNSNTASGDANSSSSISDDDKHKLFQAAGGTQDTELMQRVLKKLDFINTNGTPTDEYATFLKAHLGWALKNVEFIQSINTPEKARAYVDAHFDD